MGTEVGRSDRDLTEALVHEPGRFGFFQAVRLVALLRAREGRPAGARPPALRFRSALSLAFPASELAGFKPGATEDEMTVNFMGLTGPSGVLPVAYTELLIERQHRHRDTAAHAFLDLFNHRALVLFNAAWRKYRHWLAVEAGEPDGLTRHIFDLCGLGGDSLWRDKPLAAAGLPDGMVLRYAGLLAQRPVSTEALLALIRGKLGVPVALESFVGQWIALPADAQSRLGQQGCSLDGAAFSGERAWDRQGKMRLRIGPVRRAGFERLLPGGEVAQMLQTLLRFVCGHTLACDLVVVLDRRDVQPACLQPDQAFVLGGNAWCDSPPAGRDPDDLRYALLT